jgi:hypothetical protein
MSATPIAVPVQVLWTVTASGQSATVTPATPLQVAVAQVHLGLRGGQGVQGLQGPKGDQGDEGPKGDTGDVTPELTAARDAAQAARDVAQGHAGTAGAQAAIATTKAGEAAGSAAAAVLARDAALVGAGLPYVDEPTGRAAVADGVAFKVQGSGEVAVFEYRRVNAGSSTLIATYPSKAAVDGVQSDLYLVGNNRFANATFAKDALGSRGAGGAAAPNAPTGYIQEKAGAAWLVWPGASVVEKPNKLLRTNKCLELQVASDAVSGTDYQLSQDFTIPPELVGDVTAVGRFVYAVQHEVAGISTRAVAQIYGASNNDLGVIVNAAVTSQVGAWFFAVFDVPMTNALARKVRVKARITADIGPTVSGKTWIGGLFFDWTRPRQITFDQNLSERITDVATAAAAPVAAAAAAAVAPVAARATTLEAAKSVATPWLVGANPTKNALLTNSTLGSAGVPPGYDSTGAGGANANAAAFRIAAVATPFDTYRAFESDHYFNGTHRTDVQLYQVYEIPEALWGTAITAYWLYHGKRSVAQIDFSMAAFLLDAAGVQLAATVNVKQTVDPAPGQWGVVRHAVTINNAAARKLRICVRAHGSLVGGVFADGKAWITGLLLQFGGVAPASFDRNTAEQADTIATTRAEAVRQELQAEVDALQSRAAPGRFDRYLDARGNPLPMLPDDPVACWGDSMTAANWAATLAAKYTPARTCHNLGIGSESSSQILARIKGFDAHTAGIVWATGTVRLRARRAVPPRTISETYRAQWEEFGARVAEPRFVEFFNSAGFIGRSSQQLKAAAVAGGASLAAAGHPFVDGDVVYCKDAARPAGMYRYKPYYVRDAASGAFSLSEFPGSAAIVFSAGNATILGDFYFDWAYVGGVNNTISVTTHTDRDKLNVVLWMGRNNIGSPTQVIADVNAAVAHIKTMGKRFAILTVCASTDDSAGNLANIATINSTLQDLYPDNVIDIRAYLMTKGNGSAQDNADITAGFTPLSLRADALHLNGAGNGHVADAVHAFYDARGW